MRTRHWDQLTKDLGRDMHFDSSYTLDAALKQGLLAHLDQISKVSDVASKEYSIEQVMMIPSTNQARLPNISTCSAWETIALVQTSKLVSTHVGLRPQMTIFTQQALACCFVAGSGQAAR
jgi:hypothetical protein